MHPPRMDVDRSRFVLRCSSNKGRPLYKWSILTTQCAPFHVGLSGFNLPMLQRNYILTCTTLIHGFYSKNSGLIMPLQDSWKTQNMRLFHIPALYCTALIE